MRKALERLYGWSDGEAAVSAERRDGGITLTVDGAEHVFDILTFDSGLLRLRDGAGRDVLAYVAVQEKRIWVQIDGRVHVLERRAGRRRGEAGGKGSLGPVEAPMFGTVRKLLVEENAIVEEGQGLVVIEAMKMEMTLRAPAAARVGQICCREGIQVDQGTPLVILAPIEKEESASSQGTA